MWPPGVTLMRCITRVSSIEQVYADLVVGARENCACWFIHPDKVSDYFRP